MIRVAIADDSPSTCRLLASYVEDTGDCVVAGVAHDAASAMDLVQRTAPDVLTLDLFMPGAHGLELLTAIAALGTTRVVVVSGVTRRAAATTLRALELGAVDFVLKCPPGAAVRPASLAREIVVKIRAAAAAQPAALRPAAAVQPAAVRSHRPGADPRLLPAGQDAAIVVGASSGGPAALREMLAELPRDFATPALIVQHLPPLFTAPLAEQLSRHTRVSIREATPADRLEPGVLLVAPGGRHLLVRREGRLEFRAPDEGDIYRPSIDEAMSSAADAYRARAVGVVLTGMGTDGANGLARIRQSGGVGCVQDPATCLMPSMPLRALAQAGADYVNVPAALGALLAGRMP